VRTAAVLPVKRFPVAKGRLQGALAPPGRRALAAAMVSDVLAALALCESIERTIVVTAEEAVRAPARAAGATVLADAAEAGQSAAAELGIRHALTDGFARVLCVPGDCPALDPDEVDAMLAGAAGERTQVTIVPDRHGTGTNALVLTPADAIAPAFGPGSFERHGRLAREAGASVTVARPPSLGLDVDTAEDLAALHGHLAASTPLAVHTRSLLAELAREGAIERWQS
jgi:2-phospho-L-lactate guanylyltransferase